MEQKGKEISKLQHHFKTNNVIALNEKPAQSLWRTSWRLCCPDRVFSWQNRARPRGDSFEKAGRRWQGSQKLLALGFYRSIEAFHQFHDITANISQQCKRETYEKPQHTTIIWPSLALNSGAEGTLKATGTSCSYTKRSKPGTDCAMTPLPFIAASETPEGWPQTVTVRERKENASFWPLLSEKSCAIWTTLVNKVSKIPLFPVIR